MQQSKSDVCPETFTWQAAVLQGSHNVSTLPSGVVQVVDEDVVMQLPVLSLDNNTKGAAPSPCPMTLIDSVSHRLGDQVR